MENQIRIATNGIAEEFRAMEVGETVQFPIPKYNYNSIRSTPNTTLYKERLAGCKWKSNLDFENRRIIVKRLA